MCLLQKQKCQCISPKCNINKGHAPCNATCVKESKNVIPWCCPVATNASLCHSRGEGHIRFPVALFIKSSHLCQQDSAAILRQLFLFAHNLPRFMANQYLPTFFLKCFFTLIILYLPFLLLAPWLLWTKKKKKSFYICWKYVKSLLRVHLSFCLITTV